MGPMGLLYLTGTFNKTTGFNVESLSLPLNETRGFQLAESLKVEAAKLRSENCNYDIAGLFAMLNHVNTMVSRYLVKLHKKPWILQILSLRMSIPSYTTVLERSILY